MANLVSGRLIYYGEICRILAHPSRLWSAGALAGHLVLPGPLNRPAARANRPRPRRLPRRARAPPRGCPRSSTHSRTTKRLKTSSSWPSSSAGRRPKRRLRPSGGADPQDLAAIRLRDWVRQQRSAIRASSKAKSARSKLNNFGLSTQPSRISPPRRRTAGCFRARTVGCHPADQSDALHPRDLRTHRTPWA